MSSEMYCNDQISKVISRSMFITYDKNHYGDIKYAHIEPVYKESFFDDPVESFEVFVNFNLEEYSIKILTCMLSNPILMPFVNTVLEISFKLYTGYALDLEKSNNKIINYLEEQLQGFKMYIYQNKFYRLAMVSKSACNVEFEKNGSNIPHLIINSSGKKSLYPATSDDICYFIYKAIRKYKYNKDREFILKKAIEEATGIAYKPNINDLYYLDLISYNYLFKRRISSLDERATIFFDKICIIDKYGDLIETDIKLSPEKLIEDINTISRKNTILTSKFSILKAVLQYNTGLNEFYTNSNGFVKWSIIANLCYVCVVKDFKYDLVFGNEYLYYRPINFKNLKNTKAIKCLTLNKVLLSENFDELLAELINTSVLTPAKMYLLFKSCCS
ncbi:unknown [Clostridium sp. CAG:921]|nr:unknown [Clostridium sp. CAG:921]